MVLGPIADRLGQSIETVTATVSEAFRFESHRNATLWFGSFQNNADVLRRVIGFELFENELLVFITATRVAYIMDLEDLGRSLRGDRLAVSTGGSAPRVVRFFTHSVPLRLPVFDHRTR